MPCDPLTETSEKLRTRNDAHDYLLCGPPLSLKVGPVLWHTHTPAHTTRCESAGGGVVVLCRVPLKGGLVGFPIL